ncbi:conserved hypothetical protein [Cupriavidus necator]|uniref:YqaJ viral recombinase domain-containing protein n=1 Tax=Cupriavidus necator TaxID=106590 RepID=A0A1K0J910_CUPNE|nr:conserved hypothetical protein [Cupriavidus necator]
MTERMIHSLVQGSQEWLAHRANYWNASDAPAMMGVSPYKTRSELLHEKATGVTPDIDERTQRLFDDGHRFEALCRPLAEQIIGADLYPVSVTFGKLAASLDGLTMAEDVQWEHKSINNEIRAAAETADLPVYYHVQMEHQAIASGAEKTLFQASAWDAEGNLIEERHFWYESDPELRQRIIDGWIQFERDLAEYVPQAVEVKPLGRTPETLPALLVEVTGRVTASNLREYREHALTVFAGINRELSSDQDFADAEKTVKWCGMVEERLAAAKQHALSQTASIDELFRTIDDISAEARRVRLDLDKLVTRRKVEVKEAIIKGGRDAFAAHVQALKDETRGVFVQMGMPDFAAAVKGKRSVASIQDAVDTLLANSKIEADAAAKRIRDNIAFLDGAIAGYEFLFADRVGLAAKQLDDLKLVVSSRIATHKAEEQRKEDEQRARIQEEERAKAEAAAKAVAPAPAAVGTPMPQAQSAMWIAPAPLMPSPRAIHDGPPTLRLGQINERLAPIALTAEGLATLGFKHAATDKAAKLYHEGDFELICAALTRHIEAALRKQAA